MARLHTLYPDAECALSYSSPWELLVATILSAQCTDERVNKETPSLFARFPNVKAMAEASQEEVEELIRRTGFFRNKARAIREASISIVDNFDGELKIALGVVVDTHISRLSQRLGFTKETNTDKIEQVLINLIDQDEWIFVGHAIIWHGRRVCGARKPMCDNCTLSDLCPSSTIPK